MTDVPDDPQLHAWSARVAVYPSVLHDVVQALEGEAGLDSGVFSALAYLARAEPSGRLSLSALHDLMHPRYSQPGLSRLVQRMEADGLVERRTDPRDGRATVLVLTRAGRARFNRADGVYAGSFIAADGVERAAAISLGRRPTFYEESGLLLLEAYVLDFEGDLYDQAARVRFHRRLRGQERFESVDDLIAQMTRDVQAARGQG